MAEEPMGEPEEEEEEGLMHKLRKKDRISKIEYKQLTKGQFKTIIFGYFAEGWLDRPKAVWKKVRHQYMVDGNKIVLGDIFGLKHRYVEEYPRVPSVNPKHDRFFKADSDERSDLMKLRDDAKAEDNKELMKRIDDKLLGESSEKKDIKDRIAEAHMKQLEGGGNIGGTGGGGMDFQRQMQDQMLSQMKFSTEVMELNRQRLEMSMKNSGGGALSMDPTVALAQVIVPSIKDVSNETQETLREIAGLEPKEKKLKPGEEKKVEDAKKVIQNFQELSKLFCQCDNCGFVIPKIASECPRCGVIFEPSSEEVKLAAERQIAKGKPPVTPLTPEQLEAKRKQPRTPQPRGEDEQQVSRKVPLKDDTMKTSRFPKGLEWLDEYFKPEGYLHRLMNKIKGGHDAKKTMKGAWNLTDTVEQQKKLLFVAIKGFNYILDAAKPYVDSYGQKEMYDFFNTDNAKIWLNVGLGEIKRLSKEDGVTLTPEDISGYEKGIERYVEKETPAYTPPEPKTIECALCHKSIPMAEIDEHMERCRQEQLKKLEDEERAKLDKEKADKEKGA